MRRVGAALAIALAWACAAGPGAGGGSGAAGVEVEVEVEAEHAQALRRRAEGFYLRLAHRRFDTLETYNDFIMRDHFRSLDLFFDYYADLAEDLNRMHFDKTRPMAVEVVEISFEDRSSARVGVRFEGEDGRPLRPGSARLERTDRWEHADGVWWLQPGKV